MSFRPLSWGYLWNPSTRLSQPLRVSVPLFGAILSLKLTPANIKATGEFAFPSPKLGLSLKSTDWNQYVSDNDLFPSPYLGLSLKFKDMPLQLVEFDGFPSPYLGLSLKSMIWQVLYSVICFRPLIWGYLWNLKIKSGSYVACMCFRPLIWGYLWNLEWNFEVMEMRREFPSPNLGLSLKCKRISQWISRTIVSVPLFGVISENFSSLLRLPL